MDESKLFQRATNPGQYDSEDLPWEKEGTTESPRTLFFWEYLQKYTHGWKEKDVLDIGCGNGWLLDEAVKSGAKSALGIEPSNKNAAMAKSSYPSIEIIQTSFENFDPKDKKFDIATSIMAFSHIENLDSVFNKLNTLLRENGEVLIIIQDYDYYKSPRHDYTIEMQDIDSSQYVISVTRPTGTIADVVRKNEVYKTTAQNHGFTTIEEIPMLPTENFIVREPKYADKKDKAITQLLHFKKTNVVTK